MAEVDQDNATGKNTSKILIIIIVVLLLIIAGGGAFFMMGSEETPEADEVSQQAEQQSQEKEQSAADEFVYYEVEQPLRVNFPKGGSASLIEVKVAFLLNHEDVAEDLEKHQPMIINNLLMAISAAGADQLQTAEGKNKLRAAMLAETGKVIEKMTGKNTVREIFFTAFVMQ